MVLLVSKLSVANMKKVLSHKVIILLILIVVLGASLRFYHITSVPVAMTGDETAFGYNAFAIEKTLRDEHGQFLPLVFKSFGDYKVPLFVYFLAPLVKIFGLSEMVVRAPIALFGTLLVVLVFLIAKKLFKSDLVALLSALLLAISPWAINFSRAGWEAMMAVFLFTLAVYLFLLSLEKIAWLSGSILFFMLSFYTYHAEKVSVPLLILAAYVLFRKKIKLSIKGHSIAIIVLCLTALPAIIGITNVSGTSRARGSLITDYLYYSTKDVDYAATQNLVKDPSGPLKVIFLHSRLALSFTDIASKFFAYLSPAELFVNGDPVGRHGAVDIGILYTTDFLILLVSIYFYIRRQKKDTDLFLIIWLFLGLLPAMITKDRIHGIRSLLAIPPLFIFEAWGLSQFLQVIKKRSKAILLITVLVMVTTIGINFARFIQSYFIYTPIERAGWWQYGYKQVVETVHDEQNRFDKVVVDVPAVYGNPYIFFLFYQQFDPNLYNKTVSRQDDLVNKVVAVYSFYKYQFRQIFWPQDRLVRHVLYVGTDESIPKKDITDPTKFKLIREIPMPDGKIVFRIVETL